MMKRIAIATALVGALALPAAAQNLFAPVARVNDAVITEFEVQQRVRFMQVLNAPGASREAAIEVLIDDRLRQQAGLRAGLRLTEEGVNDAMSQFAARAELSKDDFIKALAGAGVAEQTFRDFVAVSNTWRDLVRGRYGNRVQISEGDIDRALAATSQSGSIRVLLSEIIIPAPADKLAEAQAKAEQASTAKTIAEFSAYARRFSATATRDRGGRLNWVPLSNMAPQLRSVILALGPGDVTDPLPINNAIALFQLRDIQETAAPSQEFAAVEYAAYYMAGGRSEATLAAAQTLKTQVDVCDDLYAIAQGQPEETLDRGSLAPGDIPSDIAIELAKLDPGEVSTNLTRSNGQTLVFLMLCGRTAKLNEDVERDAVAGQLRQQRLSGFADSLLEQLRADARISRQ